MARRDCVPCGYYQKKLGQQVKTGDVRGATKTAIKGAGMMLGLIPKELPNVGDEPRQGPASEPDPQKPG